MKKFEKLSNDKFKQLETATMLNVKGGAVAGPTGDHQVSEPDGTCGEAPDILFICTDKE